MMSRLRKTLTVAALGCGLAMCNIWSSLSNCETDADCMSSQRCEPGVKRCVPRAETRDTGVGDGGTDARESDVGTDAGPACETLPWAPPVLVSGLENMAVIGARLSPDELSMVLTTGDAFGVNTVLSTASRPSIGQPFRVDGPIPVVNAKGTSAFWPTMSADSLLLFFESDRTKEVDDAGLHGRGGIRIWTAKRVNKLGDFDVPELQTLFDVPVSPSASETAPYVHPSGKSLYFASSARPGHGGLDIYVATIGGLGTVTGISNIDGVNTDTYENAPIVSFDENYLYHARYTGAVTTNHIFMAQRSKISGLFESSKEVPELNSAFNDYPSWVSPDHCRIYIVSTRPTIEADSGLDADAPPLPYRVWVAARKR